MLGIGKMFRSDPMTAMALSISVESGGLTPILILVLIHLLNIVVSVFRILRRSGWIFTIL